VNEVPEEGRDAPPLVVGATSVEGSCRRRDRDSASGLCLPARLTLSAKPRRLILAASRCETVDSSQPPAKARSAERSRYVEVGGSVGGEACEDQGGRSPAAETTPCGAEREDVPAEGYDPPADRHAIYADLDAWEGQSHE
jgi:hypothetical protein